MAAGTTDLRSLGFWKLVQQVKLDRALVDEHADQIGRIDTAAFRAGVRLRAPVWLGNALLVAATIVGALAVGAAFTWQTPLWKGARARRGRGDLVGVAALADPLARGVHDRHPLDRLLPGRAAAAEARA